MNIKMATNSQLSTSESKTKTTKNNYANNQNRNRIIGMEIIWRVISWEGEGGSEGKCAGIKKYKLVGTE